MQLIWRNADGTFSRPGCLERAGEVRVCADKTCGQIIVPDADYTGGRRVLTYPEHCPQCGKPSNDLMSRREKND